MEACGGAAGLGRLCGAGEALRTMEGVRIISAVELGARFPNPLYFQVSWRIGLELSPFLYQMPPWYHMITLPPLVLFTYCHLIVQVFAKAEHVAA